MINGIKYIQCDTQSEYKDLQSSFIQNLGYEWWSGGTEIFSDPVYGYPVYIVVDGRCSAIGEINPVDAQDIHFTPYSQYTSDTQSTTPSVTVQVASSYSDGAYIATASGFSIFYNNKTYVVGTDHVNYSSIKSALQVGDYSCIDELYTISTTVENFGEGRLQVIQGVAYYNGEQLHGAIVQTILKLIRDKFDIKPLTRFLDNLDKNPSRRAVTELYNFMEIGNLPITPDGCFLAYKKIRSDYKDIYTGTISNHIGAVCSMPRNKVDDNSARTCSSGLHVCSYDYLKHFGKITGDKVVICKINPKDVVSIPLDYNFTKMRVCEYTVVAEDYTYQEKNTLYGKSVYDDYDDEYNDDDYDDHDDDDTEEFYCTECGDDMSEDDYREHYGICEDCRNVH